MTLKSIDIYKLIEVHNYCTGSKLTHKQQCQAKQKLLHINTQSLKFSFRHKIIFHFFQKI